MTKALALETSGISLQRLPVSLSFTRIDRKYPFQASPVYPATMAKTSVLLLGTGFLGGSLLETIRSNQDYECARYLAR